MLFKQHIQKICTLIVVLVTLCNINNSIFAMNRAWEFAERVGNAAQREAVAAAERAAQRRANNLARIRTLEEQNIKFAQAADTPGNRARIAANNREIDDLRQGQQFENKVGEAVVGGASDLFRFALNEVKAEGESTRNKEAHARKLEEIKHRAIAEGLMANEGKRERMADEQRNWMEKANFLTNPQTLKRMVLFALGLCVAYYGTKVTAQYVQARLGKPDLVRESSRHGLIQDIIDFVMGNKVTANLHDIVLAPDIQALAYMLADDAKETRELCLPYQNILFYGPPGTGKTEFAKILARYSGMDYAILSGADFDQFKNGEGITEMHKLFDWAKTSKNGLLIFIDEADACFRNRATLDKDGVNIVNTFLSHTGGNSDKFMIVLATNYEDELDAAVRSRIHKKVPFLLPNPEIRLGILKKKFEKYIFNDSRTYEKDGQTITVTLTVTPDVNDTYIAAVANQIVGFSGRDIDQAVSEMRLRAYRSGTNIVSKEIIEEVIKDKVIAIEKDKKATEYQHQKLLGKA